MFGIALTNVRSNGVGQCTVSGLVRSEGGGKITHYHPRDIEPERSTQLLLVGSTGAVM